MSYQRSRAIGGSCLGGIIGLILGVLIGGAIGSGAHSDLPKSGPIDPGLVDSCLGFFGMILGAGIGGMVGALGGSVLGAGLAVRAQKAEPSVMPEQRLAQATDSALPARKSSKAELAKEPETDITKNKDDNIGI